MKIQKLSITVLVLAMLLAGCSGITSAVPAAGVVSKFAAQANLPGAQTSSLPVAALQAPTATAAAPAAASNAAPVTDLSGLQSALETVYQKVNPSVVNIEVTLGSSQGNSQSGQGGSALGSGFVWDTEGHIITNDHVVDGASSVSVTFSDGTTASAKVVGTDPRADLAVIQVNVDASHLKPVTIGDSNAIKVGELAIAIGNPFGLEGTMTQGIISAVGRTIDANSNSSTTQTGPSYTIPDIIQTDASINPGNSGGVLVDINGNLLGVTSAIESPVRANSGVGFAIPSALVQRIVPVLIKSGSYQHPWLGISGTDLTPAMAKAMGLNETQRGAVVLQIVKGGPADQAGLRGGSAQPGLNGSQTSTPVGGDVITQINDQPVKSFDDLVSYLFNHGEVGQQVTLTIFRDGKQQTVQLTLGVNNQQ